MSFADKCRLKGALRIRVLDAKSRNALRIITIPNQVCIGALDAIQRLASQIIPGDDDINECLFFSIWAGTGSAVPTPADLSLDTDEFRKVFDPATLSINVGGVTGLMQMQMTMEGAEGNGFTYVEAGLFTQGPPLVGIDLQTPGIGPGNARMVARQIHASVEKTAAISIEYTWRFQVLTV